MYYSSVALLALLVHIIIHFDVIINRHYRRETPAAKAYRALIISMMGFYIFDAFWGILYDARLIQAVAFDTMMYFLAMAASVFYSTRFVIRYLKEKNFFLTLVSRTGWLLIGLIGIFLILNLFMPLMFWFDEEGAYHAGNLRYLILAIQVLLFVSLAVYVLLTIKKSGTKVKLHHAAIGAYGITMAIMVILSAAAPVLSRLFAGNLYPAYFRYWRYERRSAYRTGGNAPQGRTATAGTRFSQAYGLYGFPHRRKEQARLCRNGKAGGSAYC